MNTLNFDTADQATQEEILEEIKSVLIEACSFGAKIGDMNKILNKTAVALKLGEDELLSNSLYREQIRTLFLNRGWIIDLPTLGVKLSGTYKDDQAIVEILNKAMKQQTINKEIDIIIKSLT